MNLACDDFLSDAAFTAQQDADIAVGHAVHHGHYMPHGGAWAPERNAFGILANLGAEPRNFARQYRLLDGIADGGFERRLTDAIGIVGLDDVVRCALPHGVDDDRRRLSAGQHDDLHVRMGHADRLQRFEAVHAGHRHVEQHDIRCRIGVHGLQQIAAARKRLHVVAARAEERLQVLNELLVVVDQRKLRRGH
jgi:hypothetical protein